MHHTAGALGTRVVLGSQQTGRKLITDLRAILRKFSWVFFFILSWLKMEGNFLGDEAGEVFRREMNLFHQFTYLPGVSFALNKF